MFKTLREIFTQGTRLMLLLEFIPVRCLEMSILAATYNRCDRRCGNVSSLMMTCDVPHTLRCEMVCTMTSGCKSFFFNPRTSTCQFLSNVVSGQNNETDQTTTTPDVQYYYRDEGGPNKGTPEPFTQVIYGPDLYKGKYIFKQWNIMNRQMTIYSHLPTPAHKITSMAYLAISKILLVSVRKPEAIWRTPVDSSFNWTVVLNNAATNMGVDEGRQLLFFTGIHKGKHYLGQLHLGCHHLQRIKENNRFNSLTVFPGRQLICASRRDSIYFVGYDGEVMQVLKTGPETRIAANPSFGTDDVLYCSESTHITQISLSKKGTIKSVRLKVTSLRQSPSTLIYDGNNTLYVIVYGGILTIDVLTMKVGYTVPTQNPKIRMIVLL